jgi:hypothetical protein
LVLTKSLNKDFGDEGAAREILNILMRLVSRRIEGNAFFPTFVTFLKQIEAPDPGADYPKADDQVLFNKIMFYHPKPSEKILQVIYLKFLLHILAQVQEITSTNLLALCLLQVVILFKERLIKCLFVMLFR